MQHDSEKLLNELRSAELEVSALRAELRKAVEEAQRTRDEMRQFVENLSGGAETSAAPETCDLTSIPAIDGRPYILHIEDNDASFQLVRQILQELPEVNLRRADCGRAGIAAATARNPHLILLDLDLPDIHGSEVLNALQAEPATAGIPVIVISADATPSRIERMLAAGARNYLTKPFDIRRLLLMVGKILEDVMSDTHGTAANPAIA